MGSDSTAVFIVNSKEKESIGILRQKHLTGASTLHSSGVSDAQTAFLSCISFCTSFHHSSPSLPTHSPDFVLKNKSKAINSNFCCPCTFWCLAIYWCVGQLTRGHILKDEDLASLFQQTSVANSSSTMGEMCSPSSSIPANSLAASKIKGCHPFIWVSLI